MCSTFVENCKTETQIKMRNGTVEHFPARNPDWQMTSPLSAGTVAPSCGIGNELLYNFLQQSPNLSLKLLSFKSEHSCLTIQTTKSAIEIDDSNTTIYLVLLLFLVPYIKVSLDCLIDFYNIFYITGLPFHSIQFDWITYQSEWLLGIHFEVENRSKLGLIGTDKFQGNTWNIGFSKVLNSAVLSLS